MARSPSLHIDPAYASTLRDHGVDSFAALMNTTTDANLAKPGLAPWRSRLRLQIGEQSLFLKRYQHPPLREQLAARLRGFDAVAAVEWHWLGRLRELGIPTPPPVACGWQRCAGRERASVLVTAAVPGRSLQQWVRQSPAPDWLHDPTYQRTLSSAVAAMVRRLHEANLFHRDLYLAHLFFEPQPEPAQGLAMIDLHRVVHAPLRPERWRVKDLAALNFSVPAHIASRTHRLRWFKQYRGIDRLRPTDKTLIRRVIAKTRRIARHDVRRNQRHERQPATATM